MSVIGGDITEITCNHPVHGSFTIFPKADEDCEIDTGGLRSADDDKGVDGSGNMIDVMTRSRWKTTAMIAGDVNTRKDLQKLVAVASSPVLGTWTITHVSDAVYQGKGKPVGDVKQAMKGATIQLTLAGGGQLEQIAG